MGRQVARDISYAESAQSRGGRAVIRALENASGRLSLIRRASGYQSAVAHGDDFWKVMVERYGLTLEIIGGSLANIPATGPLVVVAYHPFGILDGLMMGHILSVARNRDFRILANNVFHKAEELEPVVLPVSFDETKEAVSLNVATRRAALEHLANGGAMGVFPGGTVSTSATLFSVPLDPVWRTFTAKMIARSGAQVVPIFFDGANSRLFQVASHLHTTLRLALFIKEFSRRTDEPVRVAIGKPVAPQDVAAYAGDPKAMMDFLRARTYALSPKHIEPNAFGFEVEAKHRRDWRNGGRYF